MQRRAQAVWRGGLKDGKGEFSMGSGALKSYPYSVAKRFVDEEGTNPEELIAAAHASCFSMALSAQLGEAGITAEKIETKGTISYEKQADGWRITESHLSTRVRAPGADRAKVEKAAQNAKTGCPISNALNPKINVKMTLEVET